MNKLVKTATSLAALALVCAALIVPSPLWAQAVEVSAAVHHDVSPPLWSIPSKAQHLQRNDHPVHPLPIAPGQPQPDPALQTNGSIVATPSTSLSFAGVGDGDYGFAPNAAPPDTNGAVGA